MPKRIRIRIRIDRIALFLAALASLTLDGCSHTAARQRGTLANLRAGIELVRAIGSSPSIEREPPVDDLVGVPVSQLRAALGAPLRCAEPLEPPCQSASELVMPFYAAAVGRGPLLVLEVEGDRVTSARWRRIEMQLDAHPPASPGAPSDVAHAQASDVDRTGDAVAPDAIVAQP
jgi:hypothetical protein